MTYRIPFCDLSVQHRRLRPALDRAYAKVLDGGQFITGEELAAFEREFAAFCGAAEAIGVANGLDALRLALQALGVGPGAEVIVPAHTFVATWLAVTGVGATPVPCEPEPGLFNISRRMAEPLVTASTRAVIAVDLYGAPAPMRDLSEMCRERGLLLVEDAAQAHGALDRGVPCGGLADAGCFSFYPSKNLGALGDGGAIVTSDSALARRLRRLRNYGSEEKYFIREEGWNSRLDELQAAFLRVKLAALGEAAESRRRVARLYRSELQDIPGLLLPEDDPHTVPAWHLFVVRSTRRDALKTHLEAARIGTGIHYPVPVYRMAPFAAFGPRAETHTDRISREILSLPMWPFMPDEMVLEVCHEIRQFMTDRPG